MKAIRLSFFFLAFTCFFITKSNLSRIYDVFFLQYSSSTFLPSHTSSFPFLFSSFPLFSFFFLSSSFPSSRLFVCFSFLFFFSSSDFPSLSYVAINNASLHWLWLAFSCVMFLEKRRGFFFKRRKEGAFFLSHWVNTIVKFFGFLSFSLSLPSLFFLFRPENRVVCSSGFTFRT